MSKAYVVGAGFSRALASDMPLLDNLRTVVLHDLGIRGKVVDLSPYGDNLENWLSHLGAPQPWVGDEEALHNQALFLRAQDIIARQVDHCETLFRYNHSRLEELPEWIPRFGETLLKEQPLIVTFNYDTLVERLLEAVDATRQTKWEQLYALPLIMPDGTPSSGRVYDTNVDLEDPWRIAITKLHGSLNWKFSGTFTSPTDPIHLIDVPRGWPGYLTHGAYGRLWKQRPDLKPMIVPPSAEKSPYYRNAALRYQWQYARHILGQREEVVFLGYSLPVTDLATQNFLGESLRGAQKVTLVDISSNSLDRYRKIVPDGVEIDTRFFGIAEAVRFYAESLQ